MTVLSYLRFSLQQGADAAAFERDLGEMLTLSRSQPGFRWAEVARATTGDPVYLVVSEWDQIEQVRAWEHHPEHEAVMDRWEGEYREPFIHRRFVPWIRPEG
ncbi:MAG TPA: antibiotic biosynthesis monooxygenase family protein [Actinomycetota bacterium]|nr:antibiotic biosynthesis monooxygenase family protein [Actinomycetota bacterium]